MVERAGRRSRWVAIITGAVSVLIGVLYLGLILVLDSRGPMQPPPPEALAAVNRGDGAAGSAPAAATVSPPG
jgi:ABC-type phosphate transport system auxiliary subunit